MQERISMLTIATVVMFAATISSAKELVYLNVEQKSASIDEAIPDALDAIIDRAVEETFPPAVTNEDRQARDLAIREAKDRKGALVVCTPVDGPRKRPGSPGYVVLNATVDGNELLGIYHKALKNVKQAPKYVILLAINENLVGKDGQARQIPDRKISSAISKQLVRNGHDVRDARQLDLNKKVQLDFEKLEGGDPKTIMEIATDQGADIIVYGRVNAHGPRINDRINTQAGRKFYFWEVDGTLQAVWGDNARVLCTIPFPDGERQAGAAGTEQNGAMRALEKTGQTFAANFMKEIARLPLRTTVEFKIRGCESSRQSKKIQNMLLQVKEFTSVANAKMKRGTATIVMATTPNPSVSDCIDQFEDIEDAADVDFHVEFDEYGLNSVIAHVVPR